MALRDYDPYAPPRDVPFVAPPAPLPEGFRRFRLDKAAYGPFMRSILLRRSLMLVVSAAVSLAIFGFRQPTSSLVIELLTIPLIFGVLVAVAARRMRRGDLDSYQLLLGPRVVRRIGASLGPAEVLRPEVTRIVETRDGLWLMGAPRGRALFVARAIERYADVRGEFEMWQPIEPAKGWAAVKVSNSVVRRQGLRDEVVGTMLAEDPSLRDELETARAMAISNVPPRARRSPFRRILVLWGLLIVLFLMIWQFLAPPRPARRPRPRPSTHEPG
jgi:hypothetical protein